jgi:hypothetical protein
MGLIGAGSALAAGDANEASCPTATETSPGFRSYLPDCRAYELVTPPFKGGGPPVLANSLISESGSELQVNDIGGYGEAGDNGGFWGTDHLTVRTAAGWTATAIEPPLSRFLYPREPELDVSQNFQRTLFMANPWRPPSEEHLSRFEEHYYIREPNGAFVEVGSLLSPSELVDEAHNNTYYKGASADLSHIIFDDETRPEAQWPGDETFGEFGSLYEFVGTGNKQPQLVGVNNQGEEISHCGTQLGADDRYEIEGEVRGGFAKFNAISRSGETVFFSVNPAGVCASPTPLPLVHEIYARIDEARTVAISEPSVADCAACDTAVGDQQEALYQGASEDGSKVFFLTRQPLLGGDSTRNLYEYDFAAPAGQRIIRVSAGDPTGADVQGVVRISEDGSRVYFVAQGVLAQQPNDLGQSAVEGADNLYVYEPDPAAPGQFKTVFVTTLSSDDSEDWSYTDVRSAETTPPDGRFLLLVSNNRLTSDCSTCIGSQVYRYDALTGSMVRASIGEDGFNHNGTLTTATPIIRAPSYETAYAGWRPVSISNDGSYVFFQSTAGLTPNALNEVCVREREGACVNDAPNVYEYHEGQIYLISDGQDLHRISQSTTTQLIGASASGDDVFFTTADPLVPQDTDTQEDVYDAHVNGGFPSETAPSCQDEECQGTPSSLPGDIAPGSMTFSGPASFMPAASQPTKAVKHAAKKTTKKKAKRRSRQRTGRRRSRRAQKQKGR